MILTYSLGEYRPFSGPPNLPIEITVGVSNRNFLVLYRKSE